MVIILGCRLDGTSLGAVSPIQAKSNLLPTNCYIFVRTLIEISISKVQSYSADVACRKPIFSALLLLLKERAIALSQTEPSATALLPHTAFQRVFVGNQYSYLWKVLTPKFGLDEPVSAPPSHGDINGLQILNAKRKIVIWPSPKYAMSLSKQRPSFHTNFDTVPVVCWHRAG